MQHGGVKVLGWGIRNKVRDYHCWANITATITMASSIDWLSYGRILGLAGITAMSIPAIKSLFNRSSPLQNKRRQLYRDEDGEATNESEATCLNSTSPLIMALAASLGLSVTVYSSKFLNATDWPSIHVWVCQTFDLFRTLLIPQILLTLQATAVFFEPQAHQRYYNGLNCAYTAVLALPYVIYRSVLLTDLPQLWLEPTAALTLLLASLSIPKRPIVYHRGLRIDQEHGVSFIDKLSFSWGPFQQPGACLPEKMKMSHLPDVGHLARVRTLKHQFRQRTGNAKALWKQILLTFLPLMVQQWLFVLVNAFSEFGSRFALFKLLQCLESPAEARTTWLWVVLMGVGLLAETLSTSWVIWISQMRLHLPAEQMLKAFVLDKTTRRQLTAEKTQDANGQQDGPSLTDLVSNNW